jgi:hypothetical protein
MCLNVGVTIPYGWLFYTITVDFKSFQSRKIPQSLKFLPNRMVLQSRREQPISNGHHSSNFKSYVACYGGSNLLHYADLKIR